MHARLTYVGGGDGASWKADTQTGHSMILDGSEAIGGKNLGPRPMEMVLLGLGSCSAMDVLSILRKGRKTVDECSIQLKATRADTVPKVFTHIQMHYLIKGQGLTDPVVERAIRLSKEKYCSVAQMLMPDTQIETSYELMTD